MMKIHIFMFSVINTLCLVNATKFKSKIKYKLLINKVKCRLLDVNLPKIKISFHLFFMRANTTLIIFYYKLFMLSILVFCVLHGLPIFQFSLVFTLCLIYISTEYNLAIVWMSCLVN